MKLKPYPEYKDSGVEWLGEIPEGWGLLRLKHGVDLINQKVDGLDAEFPYTGLEHIESWTGRRIEHEEAPSNEGQANSFKTGDVLFGKLRPYLAKALAAECDGVCTGELLVFRPKAVQQRLLLYFMLSRDVIWLVDSSTYGAKMPRANWDFIGDIRVPIPEPSAQRAIAAFLDRETARIDALVAKKERQIELLKEKRQALISHAVTKGLYPNAKMKDSGVEWLGEIPEGWEVRKLKYLSQGGLANGLFKKKEYFGSGIKLLNVFDVYRDDFLVSMESLERVMADSSEQEKYIVQSGDVFFVRSSLKLEGVGRSVCALDIDEPTVFECHVVRARPNQEKINPAYLINFLNSTHATNRLISLANMVTMATIDQDKFKGIEVPLPPRQMQDKIMEFINEERGIIERLQQKITQSIVKLREYRTALISAAVTGKIDVRGEAA